MALSKKVQFSKKRCFSRPSAALVVTTSSILFGGNPLPVKVKEEEHTMETIEEHMRLDAANTRYDDVNFDLPDVDDEVLTAEVIRDTRRSHKYTALLLLQLLHAYVLPLPL